MPLPSGPAAAREADLDRQAERHCSGLFTSLWARAWGERYPLEVQPYSSCTRALLDQLPIRLELRPGSLLADLGCGTGGVGLWLARASGARLIGIDRSPLAIEIAAQRAQEWIPADEAKFRIGKFDDTGIAAGGVDAVVSIDALPFAVDVDAALAEIARILRPGGRLVFTIRRMRADTAFCRDLGPAWERVLRRNGFGVPRVETRPEVSELWRRIYSEWIAHERELRRELRAEIVDDLLAEARQLGPKLEEDRDWLLVTATRDRARGADE